MPAKMTYEVWHMLPSFRRDGGMGVDWLKEHGPVPDPEKLDDTHVRVRTLEAPMDDLEWIFDEMNHWTPTVKERSFIVEQDTHTSTSVGDIIRDPLSKACWIVDRSGFKHLQMLRAYVDYTPENLAHGGF